MNGRVWIYGLEKVSFYIKHNYELLLKFYPKGGPKSANQKSKNEKYRRLQVYFFIAIMNFQIDKSYVL